MAIQQMRKRRPLFVVLLFILFLGAAVGRYLYSTLDQQKVVDDIDLQFPAIQYQEKILGYVNEVEQPYPLNFRKQPHVGYFKIGQVGRRARVSSELDSV
jgi:hypothetical protein